MNQLVHKVKMSSGDAPTPTAIVPPVRKAVSGGGVNIKKKSPEELIAGFNVLRQEQRQIASKIFELENDLNEHK